MPATVTSAVVSWADNSVLSTKVVARLLPLNLTMAPSTKFVPLTVSVKAASPTVLLDGERDERLGAGLSILKFNGFDSPPVTGVGSKTVTENVPALAISDASISVVNAVVSTNVVVRSVPSMRITNSGRKSEPLTVSVNPGPRAIALDGERLITFGATVVELRPVVVL